MQTFTPKGHVFGPIVPLFVLEKSISAGAKLMYALLCNYASNKDHCWPSHATLAKKLTCSLSSIKNYLAELVRENLILVKRERFRSCVYYMLFPKELERPQRNVQHPMPTRSQPLQHTTKQTSCPASCSESNVVLTEPNIGYQQPKSGYINNLTKQSKEEIPPIPPSGVATCHTAENMVGVCSSGEAFEKAWEAYPKKEAKALARMAWNNLAKSKALPVLSVLLESIRISCTSSAWQREHGRFVPQMSNWLRGQRWLDVRSLHEEQAYQEQQVRQKTVQAQHEHEQQQRAVQNAQKEALRPQFEVFAAKFPLYNRTMAFGFWQALHQKGIAPLASHVPANNMLNIIEFLQEYKRVYEEHAYRAEHGYSAVRSTEQPCVGSIGVPTGANVQAWRQAV